MNTQAGSAGIDVLLVEDAPGDGRLAREALKEATVRNNRSAARDGVDGPALLRRDGEYAAAPRPGVILPDLARPRKGGREVLEEIEADPAPRSLPVVILTRSEAARDIVRANAPHADGCLARPADPDPSITVVKSGEDFGFTLVKLPPEQRP